MVDRLGRFHLDDAVETPPAGRARQDQVGMERLAADAETHFFGRPYVDTDVVASAPPGLELADDAVVLDLFADRTQ